MGILDGLLRRIGVKGSEEKAPDRKRKHLKRQPDGSWKPINYPGNSPSNPKQNTDWFKRVNVCPGSGTALEGMGLQPVDKYRAGRCPTCKRTLRATKAGNSWNHNPGKPAL